MAHVTSADGTWIVYQRYGSGPAVILIGGGLDDGSENAPLAQELAAQFTVYNFARRGRGDSGDTRPYAVQREIEDIAALIAQADQQACLVPPQEACSRWRLRRLGWRSRGRRCTRRHTTRPTAHFSERWITKNNLV
jgi:hypothetical protein